MSTIIDTGARAPAAEMDRLEAAALTMLESIRANARACLAFSGGKDSIAVGHLCKRAGIIIAVCEVSFVFRRALENFSVIARDIGLSVDYMESLDVAWLRRHPEVIFSDDAKVRSWSFAQRHQRTVKRFTAGSGFECAIFGRRTEENSVKSELYRTADGWQCHPLRSWSTVHVWTYFARHGLPMPWIYGTRFGAIEGNAPFYTLRAAEAGGIDAAWSLVSSLDPRYVPAIMDGAI